MMVKWHRPSISPRALFLADNRRERQLGVCCLVVLFYMIAWHMHGSLTISMSSSPSFSSSSASFCAILLFGPPRAFPVVWPALRRHVILPNAAYGCDYFAHTFDVANGDSTDESGRRAVDTMQQYFLNDLSRDPMTRHLSHAATIHVSTSTQAEFEQEHADLLHRVKTIKDEQGRSVYLPWKHEGEEETTDAVGILKMWHSIQQAWQNMERHQNPTRPFARVAILRWDMVYMTPVDIYQIDTVRRDTDNTHVVLPGFAKYPVNDRGVIGPSDALRVWATERFQHVDAYVQEYRFKRPGSGIHSERYMGQYLLPRMQSQFARYQFVDRSDWCFYRTRADYSVLISDCSLPGHARRDDAVAYVTGCSCTDIVNRVHDIKEITCCTSINRTTTEQQ